MFATLAHFLADLLFPWRCLRCGKEGVLFCRPCAATLPRTLTAWCPACGTRVNEQHEHAGDPCTAYRALMPYHEPWVERAVQQMKYGGGAPLARLFGTLLAAASGVDETADAVVTHVPLHRRRRRIRGYDQAEEIARAFAGRRTLTASPLLEKKRATAQQADLDGAARKENLRGAFRPRVDLASLALERKTVILMDDVVTTGATLREAAGVLRSAGARRVLAVTFAYTEPRTCGPDGTDVPTVKRR